PGLQRPRQTAADRGLVVVLALVRGVEAAKPRGERSVHQRLGRLLFPRGAVQPARYVHAADREAARPIRHDTIIRTNTDDTDGPAGGPRESSGRFGGTGRPGPGEEAPRDAQP